MIQRSVPRLAALALLYIIICCIPVKLYADDTTSTDSTDSTASEEKNAIDKDFDELDSVFSDAADVTAEQTKQHTEASQKVSEVLTALATYPIKFSGHMEAQLGYGYKGDTEKSGAYCNFINHLYFSVRPVNEVTLNADIKTSFSNAFTWRVYQMYFDYTLWDKVFISGGKKVVSWGNTKLYSSNIISDTYKSVTAVFSIPFGSASLTVLALYPLSSISESSNNNEEQKYVDDSSDSEMTIEPKDAAYAAQFSFIMGQTSVNLQARRYSTSSGTTPQFALEAKRTIFGFDVYGHGDVHVDAARTMKYENLHEFTFIGGSYRKWDHPNLGLNAEYKYDRNFDSSTITQYVGATAGISDLCNNKLALAVVWNHCITSEVGYVTPGFVITNVFPSANLDTGVNIHYNEDKNDSTKPRLYPTVGIKLILKIDY